MCKKLTSLLLTLLAVLGFSTQAGAQYIMQRSGIEIIDKMTEKYIGKSLSLAELDQIVREISQDGLFQVVYVEKTSSSNTVVVRAQESVKIKNIRVNGQSSFKENEILDALDISPGKVMSQLEIVQAVERVKDLYRNAGFYNFKVKHNKSINDDGVDLVLKIDEQDFCVIEDIQVFSKNDFLNKQIKQILPPFMTGNYQKETAKEIEKKINELLLEYRFLTAKVQNTATIFNQNKTRVKLKFTINNAIQYEFIFNGNKYFSHFDLLRQSEIGSKFLYLTDPTSEITDLIKALYLENGFPKVNINTQENYFAEQMKRVFVIKIEEGPRIRIGKIEMLGKISRAKSYYENLFKEYLAEEAHSVFYVRNDIEHAAEEMVTHLKRHGHLQAELLSVNSEITKQNTATITIQIDEGILTYVRQILFRGAKSFSNIELKEQVELEPNKPLNIGAIEKSFELLETFYKERAFLEFKIKNRNASVIQYKPGQPYADIVYEVAEGPKIFVKNISVSGSKKTKNYVILRELDFKPGDLLTSIKVQDSIDRLEKSGLFGKVNIRSLEQGSASGMRTIVVEVEDRKPGLLSSGLGIANEGLLTGRAYVGTLYNNLGGKARALSARAEAWYQDGVFYPQNRLAVSYYEPYLTKNRLRGRVSIIREEQLFNFLDKSIRSTNEIRFSTQKEFNRHLRLNYTFWRLANQETFQIADKDSRTIVNIASTGPQLELDYRNDQFVPSSGTYTTIDFEYADPILGSSRDNPGVTGLADAADIVGDENANNVWDNPVRRRQDTSNEINYYRTTFSVTRYTPLTKNKRWVWANSLRGGYLRNVSSRSDSGVPQQRSFFLGGARTIRGFSIGTTETVPGVREICLKQGLIDFDQPTSQCRLQDFFVRDDSAFFLFKTEIRFPISGNLGGLIFYDGGAVALGEFSLEDPYRDSIGIGLSYDTPVGSFVGQFGCKLDQKRARPNGFYDNESACAINFAIGTF